MTKIITRADDAGSSRSANCAIAKAVEAGFIKNVSLMAVGEHINEAADLLCLNKSICFGLHATLNAEWDNVKWKPLTNLQKNSGLVDDNGYFLPSPRMFKFTKPSMETVLREYDAQLNKLTQLGFTIAYIDSHMYAEYFIDETAAAFKQWAADNGLIYHTNIKTLPMGVKEEHLHPGKFEPFLASLGGGQYLYIVHPAIYSEEMLATGNAKYSGRDIARVRALEAEAVTNPALARFAIANGIRAIRYDEADA